LHAGLDEAGIDLGGVFKEFLTSLIATGTCLMPSSVVIPQYPMRRGIPCGAMQLQRAQHFSISVCCGAVCCAMLALHAALRVLHHVSLRQRFHRRTACSRPLPMGCSTRRRLPRWSTPTSRFGRSVSWSNTKGGCGLCAVRSESHSGGADSSAPFRRRVPLTYHALE
jgi:hypothetical protein